MEREIRNLNNYTPSEHCIKGAIHWFSINKPNKNINSLKVRPFIIIGRTNRNSNRVLISPLQDLSNYVENNKLKYPYHAELLKKDYKFLEKDSVVLLDQVYTIAKNELFNELYMGKVSDFKEIDNAIIYNFDLYQSMLDGISELLAEYQNSYKHKFSRQ